MMIMMHAYLTIYNTAIHEYVNKIMKNAICTKYMEYDYFKHIKSV